MDYNTSKATDLMLLPIGTQFYVINGNWYGKIVEHNGQKGVEVHVVLSSANYFKFIPITTDNRKSLVISICDKGGTTDEN